MPKKSVEENEAQNSEDKNTEQPENTHKRHLGKDNEEPSAKKPKFEDAAYRELKVKLAQRKNILKSLPRILLREMGQEARISEAFDTRTPLFISDIQHLVMYSQIGYHAPYAPTKWCQLDKFNNLKATYLIIIDNISLDDYVKNEEFFPFLKENFEIKLEIVNPLAYRGNLVHDMLMVPLTLTQIRKLTYNFKSLEAAWYKKKIFNLLDCRFPITKERRMNANMPKMPTKDKFSRVDLLLNGWQMVEENFPLPIRGLMEIKYNGYICTKDKYKPVTDKSPMYGVDCEMCMTTARENELTRVSIVNEKLEVVYDTLVKPPNRITDYLTQYSGITPAMMRNVTKTLEEVQQEIRAILPADAILVGQSLQGDLHALKLFHPYIIDTSIIFNLTGERLRKSKLKLFMQEFLGETIQHHGMDGHCSTEDSIACIKLVQLKLTKSIYYGDAVMCGDQTTNSIRYPELGKSNFATSLLHQTTRQEKTACVYAENNMVSVYKDYTFLHPQDKHSKKMKLQTVPNTNEALTMMVHAGDNLNIAHVSWKNHTKEGFAELDSAIKNIFDGKEGPSLHMVLLAGHGLPDVSNGCCCITVKNEIKV